MKEILKQALTNKSQTPYSRGGDIFMAENAGEIKQQVVMPEKGLTSKSDQEAPIKELGRIEGVQPQKLAETNSLASEKKPLDKMTTEELKAEYLNRLIRGQEKERGIKDFSEKEKIASKYQSENEPLVGLLEERGIGLEGFTEISRQTRQHLTENERRAGPGTPASGGSSGGSERPFPPTTDPTLKKIFDSIDHMDRRTPMYSDFVQGQREIIEAKLSEISKTDPAKANNMRQEIYLALYDRMPKREMPEQQEALITIRKIDNSPHLAPKEKEKQAINALRNISTAESLNTELIDSLMEHEEALEYLVNRIISEPLSAETSGYQLSFYGGINFAVIRDRMRVSAERNHRNAAEIRSPSSEEGKELIKEGRNETTEKKNALRKEGLSLKFEHMKSGAELFHNMNWKIITGDIQTFVDVARGITVEHLQVLQRVDKAAMVMRLYEQELQRVISRDGKATAKNYAEVTGTILDEKTGTPTGKQLGTVEKMLEEYSNGLPEEKRMEDWQMKWAYYTGRNMMNITLRAAELIAQSKEIGYKSYPQEAASRIIDPTNLTSLRFSSAEPAGGVHFLNKVKEIFHKNKADFGWLESGIKNMAGGDRKDFESRGIFNITGVWSGWRENNIIQLWDPDTNWVSYPNDPSKHRVKISIDDFMGRTKKKDPKIGEDRVEAEALRITFLDEKGELKREICHSLGILLRTSELLPSEEDYKRDDWSRRAAEAKRQVRIAIWKKVAEDNPLAMANFLRGMQFEEGSELKNLNAGLSALDKKLFEEETKYDHKRRWAGAKGEDRDVMHGEYHEKKEWKALRQKLTIAHEKRMESLSRGVLISLDSCIGIESLTDWEKEVLEDLRTLGTAVAPKMAEIKFPSNPFMNDVLFEDAKYTEAGAEFFRRRLGGDTESLYRAGEGISKAIDNPGGTLAEEMLKFMSEMEHALASPNGDVDAQNNVLPFFEAYLDWTAGGGNAENIPGFIKFFIHENTLGIEIGKALRRRNSWAQVYSGPGAAANDSFTISKILDEALKQKILRTGKDSEGQWWTDLYERMRKKRKTTIPWLLLKLLVGVIPLFTSAATVETAKESVKTERG